MQEFFASGRAADLALLLAGFEAIALLAYRARTGAGIPPRLLLGHLAAGACLLLAVRAALTGAGWPFVALPMTAALIAHAVDLRALWRRRGQIPP